MKLLGYIRRSRDNGTGVSEAQQKAAIEGYAALHEHEIVWLPADLDESGSKLTRPSMTKALETLAAGQADGLIAAYLDRLTRNVGDLMQLLKLAKAQDWTLIACDLGLDLSTKNGKMVATNIGAVAEWVLDNQTEKLNESRTDAVLIHGVHGGATPPLGYDWTVRGHGKGDKVLRGPLTPTADRARVVAGFEAFAAGGSWNVVTAAFGVKSQGNAAAILRNRVYLGEACSGKAVKEGAHEAIVSEVLFRRVQRKLDSRRLDEAESNSRAQKAPCLLAKVLRCGKCSGLLSRDGAMYRCKTLKCGGLSIQIAKVEPHVLAEALVWHAQLRAMHPAEINEVGLPVFEEALSAAQQVVAGLDEDLASGALDAKTYALAGAAARRDVEAAEAAVRSVEAENGWLGMTNERVEARILGDVEAGNLFVRQMVRATVAPVGRGSRAPASERVAIERVWPGGMKMTLETPEGVHAVQVADAEEVTA